MSLFTPMWLTILRTWGLPALTFVAVLDLLLWINQEMTP